MVTYSIQPIDRIWKAISDSKRRQILDALADGPKSTGEIVELFPSIGRTTVLKHMGVLEDVDLILVKRQGRIRWNYLNPMPIRHACSRWVSKHVDGITRSVEQLKTLAENNH